jgi:hypothetical protein
VVGRASDEVACWGRTGRGTFFVFKVKEGRGSLARLLDGGLPDPSKKVGGKQTEAGGGTDSEEGRVDERRGGGECWGKAVALVL